MKKFMGLWLILTSFFLVISCNNEAEHGHDQDVTIDLAQEKLDISQVLDDLVVATERGDFEMIAKIWLPSEDALLIGTDSGEKLDGWEEISTAIKKQFGTFGETLISITDQTIWIHEDASVAWFFEELNYNFVFNEKAMAFEGIRFTGIMQKVDGKWRLVQQHLSIPAEPEMVETN